MVDTSLATGQAGPRGICQGELLLPTLQHFWRKALRTCISTGSTVPSTLTTARRGHATLRQSALPLSLCCWHAKAGLLTGTVKFRQLSQYGSIWPLFVLPHCLTKVCPGKLCDIVCGGRFRLPTSRSARTRSSQSSRWLSRSRYHLKPWPLLTPKTVLSYCV